jgi:hypothetical protein
LAVLTLLSALAFMDRQILSVVIQPIKLEFGLSDLQIGLVTGLGFALTFGVLGVPLGRLADHRNRRSLISSTKERTGRGANNSLRHLTVLGRPNLSRNNNGGDSNNVRHNTP